VGNPEKVLKDQTVPVILGVLTTIGAFMGLMFTESELLRDFGLFASLGLAGTTVFALLFLPQFFNPGNNKKSEKAFAALEKINSFPLERQKGLIVAILAVSAVCFVTSRNVRFDSDLQNIGYHDRQALRSEKLLASKTAGGLSTVYFAAVSEDLDEALAAAGRLCKKLDTLTAGGLIKSYTAPPPVFIPVAEQQQRIARWNAFWTDEKKAAVRQNIMDAGARYKFMPGTFDPFFAMLDADYEPVSLYEAGIIPPEIRDNIIEYTDGHYLVFVPARMDRKQLMDAGRRVVAGSPDLVVVDPMYYTSDMVKIIHGDFNITLAVSSLFVLAVLLVSLKNMLLALLAFLPMGLSWYIVLGCMSIFGLEFNLINIVVSSFIFGIGVDYSIFIMDGLLAKYRRGAPLLVYHKTAIFFSAVILIVVVASLLFAVHPAVSSIGVSTLTGMGATILIAYSLQPFLFSLLITNRTAQGKAPVACSNLLAGRHAPSVKRDLQDNYRYKGYRIERLLHKELKKTDNYALLREAVTGKNSMLDYGCGFGFTSYMASFVHPQMQISGFDTDDDALAIAGNCYRKTPQMQFTADTAVLNGRYEAVVINKPIADASVCRLLLSRAATVIVRKACTDSDCLKAAGFKEYKSDAVFAVFHSTKNSR
jgi:predicted RND superfamily exporter protein/predicted RNA methylase